MPSVSVECQHHDMVLNGVSYSMYQGFMSPNEILDMSTVPRFSSTGSNVGIVNNIPPRQTPVLNWQRPLINQKVEEISETYSSSSANNLMPNPVILATNPNFQAAAGLSINISAVTINGAGGQPVPVTNLFEIDVTSTQTGKPIWILDGQHRTYGMQATRNHVATGGVDRSNEKIPFILLHGPNYTPEMLAEIFTHVTSKAKEMDPIHRAWMHYSFGLPEYDTPERRSSLEVATHLCVEGSFGNAANGRVTNPFHDRVRFNPQLNSTPYYAFDFDANTFAKLVYKHYYSQAGGATVSADIIAEQLCYAIKAFEEADAYSASSASGSGSRLFDSTPSTPLKMLGDCYVIAVLEYLLDIRNHKTYNEWRQHLTDPIREFQNNDWRLPWVGALSGDIQNDSKDIAIGVFGLYLSTSTSIGGGIRITDYLRGTGAQVKITAYYWNTVRNRRQTAARYPPASTTISVGGVNQIFTMGSAGQVRTGVSIQVHPDCKNVKIKGVIDVDINPNMNLARATNAGGQDISSEFARTAWGNLNELNVVIQTLSFSGSTQLNTPVRLDKQ